MRWSFFTVLELPYVWCTQHTPGVFSDFDQQRCDCDVSICFALTFNNRTPPPYQRITSFWFASRHARINPNFNFCSKRVRTHMHTRVNCAALIFGLSKYTHSVGGVINNPERMDKSEPTISMRWSFFMNFMTANIWLPWSSKLQRTDAINALLILF